MNILEQHIVGKSGERQCEDAYAITDNFIVIADGSTSKSNLTPLEHDLTHGQIAARTVCDFVKTCAPDIDVTSFCEKVTATLRRQYKIFRPELTMQHFAAYPEDRFTCSAIIYSLYRQEIWMIGDCHCLIINKKGLTPAYYDNPKPMEAILAARRAEIIKKLLADGMTIDEIRKDDQGRAAIIADLKESMKAQNHEYAVIDGFAIPMKKVKVISTHDASELILASDGYPKLFSSLSESESYLQEILCKDPLLINKYQATKCWHPNNASFDDRCYVRISLKS